MKPTRSEADALTRGLVSERSPSLLSRLLVATVTTGLAFAFAAATREALGSATLMVMLVAVSLSARFGGWVPGLISALLGGVSYAALLMPRAGGLRPLDPSETLALAVFASAAALVIATSEGLRGLRKQTEDQAQRLATASRDAERSRQRIAAVLDSIGDIFLAVDDDWRLTYVNRNAAEHLATLGTSVEDVLGRQIWDAVPGLRGTIFERQAVTAIRGGTAVEFEEFFPPLQRWLSVRIFPTTGEGGASAFARDVTDRRSVQDAVRESEEQLRLLAENISEVFYVTDPAGPSVVYVSPAYAELWGQSRESLYEDIRTFMAVIHPDDRHLLEAALPRQFSGEVTEVEYRIVRPDGTLKFIRDRAFPVRRPDGVVYRVVGIAEDVTARRRVEDALRFLADASGVLAGSLDEERMLTDLTKLAVQDLAELCIVYSVDGSTVKRGPSAVANDELEQMVEELRGFELDVPWLHPLIRRLAGGESLIYREVDEALLKRFSPDPAHRAASNRLPVKSLLLVPMRTRDTLVGALLFARTTARGRRYDREDLFLAEEVARRAAVALENARLYGELGRANSAKSEFLTVMSHELRTPLNAIGGYAQLLEMELRGPVTEAQREDLRRIQRSQQHLLSMITDLLGFAKLEAGHLELELQPVPVSDAMGTVRVMIEPQALARGVLFQCEPPRERLVVNADRDKLRQIMLNLLSNAVKATSSGGLVRLAAEGEGDRVVISVYDTGHGIPADKLADIFEPFVQLDSGLTRQSEGTGLGLSISRELARAMGGDIRVESTAGEGSVFAVVLPAAPTSNTPSLPPRTQSGTVINGATIK